MRRNAATVHRGLERPFAWENTAGLLIYCRAVLSSSHQQLEKTKNEVVSPALRKAILRLLAKIVTMENLKMFMETALKECVSPRRASAVFKFLLGRHAHSSAHSPHLPQRQPAKLDSLLFRTNFELMNCAQLTFKVHLFCCAQ